MNDKTTQHDPSQLLYSAFVRAQKKFGKALKTSQNPHFKSRYADLGAVTEAVIDALHSEGFALTQKTSKDVDGILIHTHLLHESGHLLDLGELWMPSVKNDPQGFGSAMTYCRRYSLMAAMGIAPEDDDGNLASRPAPSLDSTLLADHIAKIAEAADEASLLKAYTDAFKASKGDAAAQKKIVAAKDERKAALGVAK